MLRKENEIVPETEFHQEGDHPIVKITSNTLSLWQAAGIGVSTFLAIGGIVWSGVQGLHNDISGMRQDISTVTLRVSNLEEKDRFYDRMVDTRSQQIMDIKSDLSSIKAYIEDSREENRRLVPSTDPNGRK